MAIDIGSQVDRSALVENQEANASDVKTPLDDLVGVTNNILNGGQEFEVLRGVQVSDPDAHATHWKLYFKSTGLFIRQSTAAGGSVVGPLGSVSSVDADDVDYIPTNASDWNASPTDATEAFDELADRVKTVEGGGGGGGAPDNATYITQTPSAGLSAEQALSSLATGLLKNTTGTGVLSIATGSDLPSHDHDAADIDFTPDESGDWDSPPTKAAPALDELAGRVTDLEAGGGGGGSAPQFVQVASVTVGNSTSEATLIGSGIGSTTISAGALLQGKSIRIAGAGMAQRNTGNFILRFKLGGSMIIATANAAHSIGTAADSPFRFEILLTCRSSGASGTIMGQGSIAWHGTNIAGALSHLNMTSAAIIDTTGTLAIDLTAQWSAAASNNTITLTNLVIELV